MGGSLEGGGLREGGSIRKRDPDLGVNEGNPRHTHVCIPPYTLTEEPHTPTSQLSMDWWPIFPLAALLLLLLLLPMCLSR